MGHRALVAGVLLGLGLGVAAARAQGPAIRFYQEQRVWTAALEQAQQRLLAQSP